MYVEQNYGVFHHLWPILNSNLMGGLPKLAREASQLSDRVSRPQTWDFEIGNIILVGEEIRFELQRKYDLDLE